jgi:hypothetical protein
MTHFDPIRSMLSLYGRFRRTQVDPKYSLLWTYAKFQRMECSMGKDRKEKGLHVGQMLFRWAHDLFRILSSTKGPHTSLPWFSDKEAIKTTSQRNRLLNALPGQVHLRAKTANRIQTRFLLGVRSARMETGTVI